MCKEDIKKINEWFNEHSENYGTYHIENEYAVCESDLESLADFLRKEFPDLICINCCFGKGDSIIWFSEEDLENAKFY